MSQKRTPLTPLEGKMLSLLHRNGFVATESIVVQGASDFAALSEVKTAFEGLVEKKIARRYPDPKFVFVHEGETYYCYDLGPGPTEQLQDLVSRVRTWWQNRHKAA